MKEIEMRCGTAKLEPILELERLAYQPQMFFDAWHPEIALPDLACLGEDHFDLKTGEILLSHHAWFIDTGRYKILIDPCVGNNKRRHFAGYNDLHTPWLERLIAAGARPEDIDFVLCTHLHPDHCGWNTRLADGEWVPTFPNARYIFSRAERDYWGSEEDGLPLQQAYNSGVFLDSVRPVITAGQAMIIDGGVNVANSLSIFSTPGHTPGHLSAILGAGSDGAIFTGDTIHHPLQILHPAWSTAGCHNTADARRSRQFVLNKAAEQGLLLAPAHFRGSHMCRIGKSSDGEYALEWA